MKVRQISTGLLLMLLSINPLRGWALPIETDTALTLGFESNALRSFVRMIRQGELIKDGDAIPDPEDKKITLVTTPLIVPIRLSPDLVFTTIIPVLKVVSEKTVSGSKTTDRSSGVGDLQVVIKHAFFKKDGLKKTTRLAWTAGLKLPTGDETLRPALGSGSVDFIVGGIVTHIVNRFAIHGDLKYKINTEAKRLRVGNSLKHDLALEYRVMPQTFRSIEDTTLNLLLELNGIYQEQSKIGGNAVTNTGGETLFLSPGFQVVASPRLIFEGLLQYPIIQLLNGTQLGIDYTASIGFRYSF